MRSGEGDGAGLAVERQPDRAAVSGRCRLVRHSVERVERRVDASLVKTTWL